MAVVDKQEADLATEWERHLTTAKRAKRTKTCSPMPSLPLSHWSSQLFDLRAPSSTDVPVLLLNQPNECMDCPPKNDPCGEVAVSGGSPMSQQSRMLFFQLVTQVAPK